MNKDSTTIDPGAGSKKPTSRSESPSSAAGPTRPRASTTREKFQERLSQALRRLRVLIHVVAAADHEADHGSETKARVEDALHATRAAAEEGIVPGGGVALLRVIPAVRAVDDTLVERREVEPAAIVLRVARGADPPHRLELSGHDGGASSPRRSSRAPVRSASTPTPGEYVDMFQARDRPTRPGHLVKRCQNAASIFGADAHHRGDDHQHQGRRGEGKPRRGIGPLNGPMS